jgi:hypothetical protein
MSEPTGIKCKIYKAEAIAPPTRTKRTVRKHLNADALLKAIKQDFCKIPDHRAGNSKISKSMNYSTGIQMIRIQFTIFDI